MTGGAKNQRIYLATVVMTCGIVYLVFFIVCATTGVQGISPFRSIIWSLVGLAVLVAAQASIHRTCRTLLVDVCTLPVVAFVTFWLDSIGLLDSWGLAVFVVVVVIASVAKARLA